MNHRGIEYEVAQVAVGGVRVDWKWSVRIDPYTSAIGGEQSRSAATAAAEKKIDRAVMGRLMPAPGRATILCF
jgi:hypothetical protein